MERRVWWKGCQYSANDYRFQSLEIPLERRKRSQYSTCTEEFNANLKIPNLDSANYDIFVHTPKSITNLQYVVQTSFHTHILCLLSPYIQTWLYSPPPPPPPSLLRAYSSDLQELFTKSSLGGRGTRAIEKKEDPPFFIYGPAHAPQPKPIVGALKWELKGDPLARER